MCIRDSCAISDLGTTTKYEITQCSDLYSNCLFASANYISSSQNNSADVINSEQLHVNIVHNSANDESMSGCCLLYTSRCE